MPARRTVISRYLAVEDGRRVWVEKLDMAPDNGVHFSVVGKRFVDTGRVRAGRIGGADSYFASALP